MQQQVAEVAGVQRRQPRLIGGVQGLALAVGKVLAGRKLFGRPAAVLPVIDQPRQRARRPAFGVDIGGLEQLFQQPLLVVRVQDGEGRFQPDDFGMTTQDLGGDRVEGAEPAQTLGGRADQMGDPLAHLARGLVGEGDDQQLPRTRATGGEDVGESRRQDASLASACAGEHQHWPLRGFDGLPLFGIQSRQIVGRLMRDAARTARAGEVGDAGSGQGVGQAKALGVDAGFENIMST